MEIHFRKYARSKWNLKLNDYHRGFPIASTYTDLGVELNRISRSGPDDRSDEQIHSAYFKITKIPPKECFN